MICVFQVTWNFNIATVRGIIFYRNVYIDMIGNNMSKRENSVEFPKKILKNVRIGGKKLGTAG